MSILESLIFFLVLWWPIFFISLPFGFQPITNNNEENNFAKSAPAKPRILKKFIITTILSFVITIIIWLLTFFKIFSFKDFLV